MALTAREIVARTGICHRCGEPMGPDSACCRRCDFPLEPEPFRVAMRRRRFPFGIVVLTFFVAAVVYRNQLPGDPPRLPYYLMGIGLGSIIGLGVVAWVNRVDCLSAHLCPPGPIVRAIFGKMRLIVITTVNSMIIGLMAAMALGLDPTLHRPFILSLGGSVLIASVVWCLVRDAASERMHGAAEVLSARIEAELLSGKLLPRYAENEAPTE